MSTASVERRAFTPDGGGMSGSRIPLLAAVAFAAIVTDSLLPFVGREKVFIDGWVHFGGVAFGASVAVASAVALTVAGVRRRDAYAVLVGSAFSLMATAVPPRARDARDGELAVAV